MPRNTGDEKSTPASAKSSQAQAPASETSSSSPGRWIHSQKASVLFTGTIFVNAIILGIETDHRPESGDALSQPLWFAIDSAFNLIYLTEFCLRLEAERASWHKDPWNIFDALVLLIGITDIWIISLAGVGSDVGILSVMRIFRLLRLTRVLRILRLVRVFQELWLLLNAIAGAMTAMCWALLLFSAVLFISAMFTTRLVGQECCDDGMYFTEDLFREWFGTVPRSLFTLFQFATLENWPYIAREAFDQSALLVCFIIVFILLTNIMLFNTVASIVVENVLSVAQREEESRRKAFEDRQRTRLRELFDHMDTNKDGTLEWCELQQKVKSTSESRKIFRMSSGIGDSENAVEQTMLDLTLQHSNLSALDARELFNILDSDGSGSISKEEFVESTMLASVPPTPMALLQLSSHVKRTCSRLQSMASRLQNLDKDLRSLGERMQSSPSSQRCDQTGSFSCSGLPMIIPAAQPTEAAASELAEFRQDMFEALAGFEDRLTAQLGLGQRRVHSVRAIPRAGEAETGKLEPPRAEASRRGAGTGAGTGSRSRIQL